MASEQTLKLGTLTQRPEFLYVREGRYAARGAVVVQCRAANPNEVSLRQADVRYGVTATKKIGNAVTRNRAKRRLRAAARELLPQLGRAGHDYVLIARDKTTARDWSRLLDDVRAALQSVAEPKPKRAHRPSSPRTPSTDRSN